VTNGRFAARREVKFLFLAAQKANKYWRRFPPAKNAGLLAIRALL
jgi:hypothetical protein